MGKFPADIEPDLKRLLKRIEFWQRKLEPLGLKRWRLEVSYTDEVEGHKGAVATASPSTHYDTVWFQFERAYVEEADRWKLDETIIHEWLHVLMRDLDTAIHYASEYMSPQVCELWECQVEHEREGLIEALARAIRMLHDGSKR